MSTPQNTFTEPEIVTTDDLKHRSYITFYFNGERVREYHGKSLNLDINPNRAKSIDQKTSLLKKLYFEIHKALDANAYPANVSEVVAYKEIKQNELPVRKEQPTLRLLFNAITGKLRSDLSL